VTFISDIGIGYRVRPRADIGPVIGISRNSRIGLTLTGSYVESLAVASYVPSFSMTATGNGNLRNAKVRKVICEITCEKCVRKISKTRKIRLCEIGVWAVLRTVWKWWASN